IGVSRFLPTETLGTMIMRTNTFTVAVAGAIFGALAVIMLEPVAKPVTGTFTLLDPDGNVTVAGTVAAAGLLDARLIVNPVSGAFPPVRLSVRLPGVPASKV